MKAILFSDSHGYTHNMIKALSKNEGIDLVIHLGDVVKDILKVMETFSSLKYAFVPGNNDWSRVYEKEKLLVLEGKRILITHGHLYGVKFNYLNLIAKGRSLSADAVFFGHTHETEELYDEGLLLLNPGSISLPANSAKPTYCIVDINKDRIVSRFAGVD